MKSLLELIERPARIDSRNKARIGDYLRLPGFSNYLHLYAITDTTIYATFYCTEKAPRSHSFDIGEKFYGFELVDPNTIDVRK